MIMGINYTEKNKKMLQKYTTISFCGIALAMLAMLTLYSPMWKKDISQGKFTWDANGYYAYLPATFLYKDLKHHNYRHYIATKYNVPTYMWGEEKEGHLVLQYACGMAVIELPWFAMAHLTAKMGGYDADGYSMPYQLWLEYGLLLFALLGIYLLGKLLLRYFSDMTSAITLFCLTVGTNYFIYGTIANTNTHAALFTVYMLLIWATIRFYENINFRNALQIGLWVGLATLVRPTEAIALFIPLLWGVSDKASLLERLNLVKTHLPKLLLAIVMTIAIGSLQLLYWKYTSGNFVYYSYGDQTFSFLKPHLYDCFLSSRKGWITYTPIVVVGLIGFYPFWRKNAIVVSEQLHAIRPVITLIAVLSIWISFSWDIWWYGGGLGQRAMIQYLPFFAFPFAACLTWFSTRKIAQIGLATFIAVALYHNAWVTHGGSKGGYIFTEFTNDAYFFGTLWQWSKPTVEQEGLLDNPENNLILQNPKLVYSNDFEQDTTTNATNESISGKKSLQITKDLQFSQRYDITAKPTPNSKIAATATLLCKQREWDMYAIPMATLVFSQQGKDVKTNAIAIHRQLNENQNTQIRWTALCPDEPYDKISVYFWNRNSKTTTFIDDLKVEIE